MIRARAVDILLRSGARLGRGLDGALVSVRVPPELEGLADTLAADIAMAVAGHRRIRDEERLTGRALLRWMNPALKIARPSTVGHAWRRCNQCGRERLCSTERRCILTPGCKGRALTYHDPPALTLGDTVVPCVRAGCDRPAVALTAGCEPLCQSDLTHLALANEYHRRMTT